MIVFFVVVYEVMLGIMFILGYVKRFMFWSFIVMIVFFIFFIFYLVYFNKVIDCGCFGDVLKLMFWEFFWKDIVLLILIFIVFFWRNYLILFFMVNGRSIVVMIFFVFCFWLGYYVLMYFFIVDFRVYKIGNNI